MRKRSAGLLMYRVRDGELQVLLGHPGGPFFRNRDEGVWSIPKGELDPDEVELAAAEREFQEETAVTPEGPYLPLTPVLRNDGKHISAWAFEGDCDVSQVRSNLFTMQWPPHSGQQAEFPEIDRAAFFDLPTARAKIHPSQAPWLEELERHWIDSRSLDTARHDAPAGDGKIK